MKYNIVVEIPDGKYCEKCQFIDSEFEYCHIVDSGDPLKWIGGDQHYIKDPQCPALICPCKAP